MSNMIALADPGRDLSAQLLSAPGGFAWWYADMLDAEGNGFVLIWSFGLPFLPGHLGAARAGHPIPAGHRPSLNLVLYKGGRSAFYLLQEYAPENASWGPNRWQFEKTVIEAEDDATGRRTVEVRLDCPIPRSSKRLTGTIRLSGPVPRHDGPPVGDDASHSWCPMMGPAWCQAEFRDGSNDPWSLEGWAYHDRNGGPRPLDALGIDRWTWGRTVEADRLRIYYVLWPQADDGIVTWGLEVDPTGEARRVDDLEATLEAEDTGMFGMRYHRTLHLNHADGTPWLTSTSEALLDDGPFYLRNAIRGTADGKDIAGTGEWVVPDRIDRPWQRPFVRMRVHRVDGPSSMWLPLFSGPRQGRWRRLVGLS